VEKRRTINISFIEVVRINISSLENCDRLDFNYTIMRSEQIKLDSERKLENIKFELAEKLEINEKKRAHVVKVATSFGWLAILMIFLLFLISILIDCQKLISYLKKYYCIKTKRRLIYVNPQKEKRKRESVFKQL
jgi:hypothetical protein